MSEPLQLEFALVSSDYAAVTAISRGVKKYGAKSSLSPGAEPARDSLRRRKVDGVFVDMEAPGALALIMDIRKGTSNSKSVIFACVQSSKESTVTLSAGANFLLLKPLTAESVTLHITSAKEMMEREHRRYFRHPMNLPVLLKDADGDQRARMANLSEGGIAVRTTRALKHSSMIEFEFELPFGETLAAEDRSPGRIGKECPESWFTRSMARDESSWKHGLAQGNSFPPRPSLQKLPRKSPPPAS